MIEVEGHQAVSVEIASISIQVETRYRDMRRSVAATLCGVNTTSVSLLIENVATALVTAADVETGERKA